MFKVHGFLNDKMVMKQRMEHLPRNGDTMRLTGERYAKVTEVIWCMDEQDDTPSFEGQRVNLRMVSITPDDQDAERRANRQRREDLTTKHGGNSAVRVDANVRHEIREGLKWETANSAGTGTKTAKRAMLIGLIRAQTLGRQTWRFTHRRVMTTGLLQG